jgi:hypothetical protein
VSHDALVDCENALKAIEKMAGAFDEGKLTSEDIDLDF